MSNSPYKNLVNNSITFTIANLGSKVLSFIMVPLYTYVLSTDEYGTVDIMTTLNSLLLPLVFLCTSDAVLRYALDTRYDKKKVLSTAFFIYIGGTLVLCICLPLIRYFYPEISQYLLAFILLFICNGIMQVLNQFLRASDHVKAFAVNGVIYTFVFAGLNIVFLVKLHLGVFGYLYSIILADSVCIIFASIVCRVWRYIEFKTSKEMAKIMLKYSIPLIPNALMWWIMDASDKFVITYFLGIGANGLYAVSKKIPTLIDTFHSIFNQAWQISAIQENETPNSKNFTSKVYRIYFALLFLIVSFLMVIVKPLVIYILSEAYEPTWRYIPFLLVSVAISSLSGFLSSKLIASEQTNQIFKTTVIGAIVNTILNFILIPILGINGAALATLIGFAAVLFIRERFLKKHDKIEIQFNRFFIFGIIGAQILAYYILSLWMSVVVMLVFFISLLVSMRKTIIGFIKLIVCKDESIENIYED